MRYLGVEDNSITTLTVGINASATSFTVNDGSVFGAAEVPFAATIYDAMETAVEVVLVTDVSGNTLTVERGYKFAAVAHNFGDTIEIRVLAQHVDDLNENNLFTIQQACHVEHVKNASQQVTTSTAWEDAGKTVKVAEVTYTYADSLTKIPSTATRIIYYADGTSTRRTESTTFTIVNHEITKTTRVIS